MVSEMGAMLGGLATGFAASLKAVCFATAEPMALSKGFPPDFGVLAEPNEPNEAKAPDPRPKALEAPPVGDTSPLPGVVLKDLPCDDFTVALREPDSPPPKPLAPLDGVVKESFDELDTGMLVRNSCAVEATYSRAIILGSTSP